MELNQSLPITLKNFQWLIHEMRECLCLRDNRIVLVNEASANALGWAPEALIGKAFQDILDEATRTELLDVISNAKAVRDISASFRKKDGSILPVDCSVFYLQELTEERCSVITFRVPAWVTKGKTLSFHHLFESNMFGMVYGDIYGKLLEANDAFLDMVGYPRESFMTGEAGWLELTVSEDTSRDEAAIQQLKEFGAFTPYEKRLIRKDGSLIDVFVGGVLEEDSSDRAIAFVIDISAKKRAERAVIKGEELFRSMAEASDMMIWIMGPNLKIHYINKSCLDFVGFSLENFPASWEPLMHPDDVTDTVSRFKNAIENKTHYSNLFRARRADGQYRWLLSSGGPAFSNNGEFLGYVGTVVDVHDLKEAQAKLAQYAKRLEQSNRELEHFATIASHDLQEPLRKVRVFSDHLIGITKGALNEEALDDLERIQHSTARMQRLIEDLLDLSRISRRGQAFQKIDLKSLIEEVIAGLRYAFEDVHSRVELVGSMTIEADPNQMRQMMTQLLDNALKFHQPGQPSKVQINIQAEEEERCRISITDNGIGMKAEHLNRIFDTFVRLHHGKEYSGTGIGLALVKRIVERHHGSISVESQLGEGSTFVIIFPAHNYDKGIEAFRPQ